MSPFWAELEDKDCPCQGTGWGYLQFNWEECPIHYEGQLHPDTKALIMDDSILLEKEIKRAYLTWKFNQARDKVKQLRKMLDQAESDSLQLELELVNKTTTRKMSAVSINDAIAILKDTE